MREAIHHAIDVDAAPPLVWRVFSDLAAWPRWFPYAASATAEADPWRPGGALAVELQLPVVGRLLLRLTVEEAAPPTRVRWTGGARGLRGDHLYTFEDRGRWTRITSHETFGGAFAPIARRLAWDRIDEASHQSLARLRALVEEAQGQGSRA